MDRLQAQLRWQCRRGCKELDVLLINYLEQQYPNAPLIQQQQFEQILNLDDNALLSCLHDPAHIHFETFPLLKTVLRYV